MPKHLKLCGKLHKSYHIIYIIFWINSNGYVSHCGGSGWGVLMKRRRLVEYRFLAKSTTWSHFFLITYIVFVTKMQKKANPKKMICPYWKTISQVLNRLLGLQINCRNMQFSPKNWDGWYHRFFEPLFFTDKLEVSQE